jgi:NodT family efflux transporter outer membrane factor (OMF) lipoprotein
VTPSEWRSPGNPDAPIEADWWRGFHDPVLVTLVEHALANNADIGQAAARVQEARALSRFAMAQQMPLATFGASTGESEILVLTRGVVGYGLSPQVGISYDLDLFGRLSQASASAKATLLATKDTQASVELALASTTASAYITLLGLDARLDTTRATVAAREEALRVARRRTDAGYGSQLELRQAESEYEAARQLVPPAELAVTRQENALSILVGDPPHAIARGRGLEALAEPIVPAGLPSTLLKRRPDLAAAEATLVASDFSLDSARAAELPDFALTGSEGVVLTTSLPVPVGLYSVAGGVTTPLFDGGRLRAQSEAAAARRDQAAFAYRRTVLTALREVEDSLTAVQRLREQQAAVDKQIAVLSETLRLATNRYKEGYAPYLDQIDAQRGLLTAQLVAIQIKTDQHNAIVTLFQALGGGWRQPESGIRATEETYE